MRRSAWRVLLGANLLFGLLRLALPPDLPTQPLWDLQTNLDAVEACRPLPSSEQQLLRDCPRLAPFLPLFPLLERGLATLPRDLLVAGWYGGSAATLALCFLLAAKDTRQAGMSAGLPDFLLLVASLALFKGTTLGVAAGQPSLAFGLLLVAFARLLPVERAGDPAPSGLDARRWLAAACLALAATKPNLAPAFFGWLLLRRDFALLFAALALTLAVNFIASLFWLGPLLSFRHLLSGPSQVASWAVNDVALAGASGRVDLEPLLVALGIAPFARRVMLIAFALAAVAGLWRARQSVEPRRLLVAAEAFFLAWMYHRDYDLLLLVLVALPLLRERDSRAKTVVIPLVALPFVLPLQGLHGLAMQWMPSLGLAWDLAGCSTALALVAIGVLALRPERDAEAVDLPAAFATGARCDGGVHA